MTTLEFSKPDVYGVKRTKMFFDNGYGLSIITVDDQDDRRGLYVSKDKPYECAVLVGSEDKYSIAFDYDKVLSITRDDGDWPVFGWCDKEFVDDIISEVQSLDKLTE